MEDMNIKVVKALKEVMKALKQNMDHQFKAMNLTGSQGMLVSILAHGGELKISDIGRKLGLSDSTVSGIVDRLEKQGMVERTRSKDDRRVVLVNVTSHFRKLAGEHFSQIESSFKNMLNEASVEELDTVYRGLETLNRLIRSRQENV